MSNKIEISYKTIVFTVFFLSFFWVLIQVKEIIYLIFVSFILMAAFKPWVDFLEKHHIPRVLAALIVYVVLIVIIAFTASSIIPPLIIQSVKLYENFPKYFHSALPFFQIDQGVISQNLGSVSQNIVKVTVGFFNNIISLFTLFVISYYLLLERKNIQDYMVNLFGKDPAEKTLRILESVELRLGAWVRAQMTLMLIIGIFSYLALLALGIPYALPLSILAGILEIVPTIGPIISSIPAILVALMLSPLLALAVTASFILIQQIENNLIVPYLMKKAVGLPPLITIVSIMIGAKLAGITGGVLAVPLVLIAESVITEYLKIKEE